ncbi:hypothetical protein GCM10011371_05160 [Novosphingobium marinum]|nr:hypothetical protein GCM10011371_05160 [Novosphingobium marinum]
MIAARHEPVRRQVDDVQVNVPELAMFGNDLVVDRMPYGLPLVRYRELCAHVPFIAIAVALNGLDARE